MENDIYLPKYNDSNALVIGINKYKSASPLNYALNDAESVKDILVSKFNFKPNNIKFLTDGKATKENIMSAFLSYANKQTNADDKILFFFAGHGHTITGKRGEVGYLIPYNGSLKDLSTLIRWDEITRNADLITAKHILFIMDACYGGLAITRTLPPGSKRFLKDMMQRYSRQVLTAGKANETVSDSGGPLPDHSVFTGHFLEALNGKAETADGVITANGVISYVYERVAKDPYSKQTPHYGFLDGDGDFIFKAPILETISESPKKDNDVLVSIPSTILEVKALPTSDIVAITKEYISDSKSTIKLHDIISQKLREFVANMQEMNQSYDISGHDNDEFRRRLKFYESRVRELQLIAICIAYWGSDIHRPMLRKIIARATDPIDVRGGIVFWLRLRWYPIMLLTYASGISAISSNNYSFLSEILLGKVRAPESSTKYSELAIRIGDTSSSLHDNFKTLPGHEKNYAPRSEYLFKFFQPFFDDLLFLGSDYEYMFDKFEVYLALVCADLNWHNYDHFWGPPGRFAWKTRGMSANNPFSDIVLEAESFKNDWEPLKYNLFQGSYERFTKTADEYKKIVGKLGWI